MRPLRSPEVWHASKLREVIPCDLQYSQPKRTVAQRYLEFKKEDMGHLERYNSGTGSLDFASDDLAGLSASELEPSPDGAAAGAMRRATGNSGTESLDLAADDPAGWPASDWNRRRMARWQER